MGHVFTRAELHTLVWSEPMRSLSQKYGFSDRGLAKACDRANIPVPPRGYWNKLQAGYKVIKRPLPSRGLGVHDEVIVGMSRYEYHSYSDKELLSLEIPDPPRFDEEIEAITDRVRREVHTVPLSKSLTDAYLPIRRLLEEDEQRRKAMENAKYVSSLDKPYFDSPLERRRLKILNALFLRAARMGYAPSLRGKLGRDVAIKVGDEAVAFHLEDVSAPNELYHWNLVEKIKPASTPMILKVITRDAEAAGLVWRDQGDDIIEHHLAEILTTLIVTGERFYREGVWSHRDWLIKRKEWAVEEEEQARIQEEKERKVRIAAEEKQRIDHLLAQAAAFRQAIDIRGYVDQVRSSLGKMTDEALEDWTSWALAEADRIDPVKSKSFLIRPTNEIDGTD